VCWHGGTRHFRHEHALAARKNCWLSHEWSVIWSEVFSDLDFADDAALLAELRELLVHVLQTTATEAASLGLEVNWQKTKVQALGSREDEPSTITAQGQEVAVVEEFVYLGSFIH